MAADDTGELRSGDVPLWVIQVIDAHVAAGMGRKNSRNKVWIAALEEWARGQIHLATVIQRVTRGNGNVTPSDFHGDGD